MDAFPVQNIFQDNRQNVLQKIQPQPKDLWKLQQKTRDQLSPVSENTKDSLDQGFSDA